MELTFFYVITDELTGILKKLSLEKYQPIFEEQEVCLLEKIIFFYRFNESRV